MDRTLDAVQAAAIIRTQFPKVSPSEVSYLGEGCDSTAFEVNGQWVFRFPKRADVEAQLAIESRVLPVLSAQSPLQLPVFAFHGLPSAEFPYHFVGYRKIPGAPAIGFDPHTIQPATWAPAAGRFLSWLHGFSVDEANKLGVPRCGISTLVEEVGADALDDFNVLDEVMDRPRPAAWRAFFEAGCRTPTASSPAVLTHCDLAAEHILYDRATGELTGIIDWSDMAISDRSADLSGFFHWGGRACLDAVLTFYEGPIDDGMLERARFLAACRGIGDIAFGLRVKRREYIEAGLRALAFCFDGE